MSLEPPSSKEATGQRQQQLFRPQEQFLSHKVRVHTGAFFNFRQFVKLPGKLPVVMAVRKVGDIVTGSMMPSNGELHRAT